VRARVEKIVVEKGRATGVICKGVQLKARYGVISNAGHANTFQRLIDEAQAKPVLKALDVGKSVRLVYVFIGMDQSDEALNLPGTNYWCLSPSGASNWDHDKAMADLASSKKFGEVSLPAVFMAFGSAKDDEAKARGAKASFQLLAPVNYEWFEKFEGTKIQHRGAEYNALKEEIKIYLLENYLYKHFPQCKGHVKIAEVATPLTTNFYLNTLRGETYGLAHTLDRFSLDVQEMLHTQTHIKNLYVVGQDQFSVGIIAALASGVITAAYISKKALFNTIANFILG